MHITASVALDYVPIICFRKEAERKYILSMGSMPWEGSKILV